MKQRASFSIGRFTPMWRLTVFFLILLHLDRSDAVAIDNGIAAPPDVECLDDRIRVWVHTRKYFAGRIYAKGRAEYQACIQTGYAPLRTLKPHFEIPFGQCGMQSLRSIDPRGMYYGVTIMVSFHPLIVTKVDQAFHVKCFFEEANRGLTAELGVSMIPTTEVGAHHGIPGCTYSMHSGTITQVDSGYLAPVIQHARVGDKILHRWECADNMYGVLINNCYVTDGFGARAEVVDSRGCPIDPILITGIRYARNLTTAFAESHVFKFADKPGVWFFCQIQMCMKGAGMCAGITPPQCSNIPSTTNYVPEPAPAYTQPPTIFGPGTFPQAGSYPQAPVQQPYPGVDNNNVQIQYNHENVQIPLVFEHNDVAGVSFEDPTIPPNDDNSLAYTDYYYHKDSPPPVKSTTLSGNDLRNSVSSRNDGQVFASPTREPKKFPDNLKFAEEDLKFLHESKLDIEGYDRQFFDEDLINYITQPSPTTEQPKNNPMKSPKVRKGVASVVSESAETKEEQKTTLSADEDMMTENPEPQEIVGQLLIYDLDEDPPSYFQRSTSELGANEKTIDIFPDIEPSGEEDPGKARPIGDAENCPITSQSLLILIAALVGSCAILFFTLFGTCMKLRSKQAAVHKELGGAYNIGGRTNRNLHIPEHHKRYREMD